MRKYYLDNIRWITVLIVLVFHVFFLYNMLGAPGGIGGFYDFQPWDAFCTFAYPWFMVLLFVIAGISARYALGRQTPKEFIKSKTDKLLVPSTLGLFIYHFGVGYLNVKIGGVMDLIPKAIRYPVCVISGTGPLWFIQMLYVFSLLLVLIRKVGASEKLWNLGGKCNLLILLLLFLPIWGAAQILNMPMLTMYRFGIYFLAYLLGCFIFSHDEMQALLGKNHILLLALALAAGVVYNWHFFGENYYSDKVLHHFLTNLYLWMMVLAILGCGKVWCNKTSKFAAYMTKSSFGIYVVHYLIVLSVCLGLKRATFLPVAVIYILAILLTLGLSPLMYELLRRIPFIRYITFGIRTKKG